MQGVLCTTQQATSLRLTLADASEVVQLQQPIDVCVDAGTQWTSVSALTLPYPAPCPATSLRTTVRNGTATPAVRYLRIVFTNITRTACTLRGTPRVQATFGAAHRAVGPPATVARRLGWTGGPVNLGGRATRAYSVLAVTAPAHYGARVCAPAHASALVVTFGRSQRVVLPISLTVCTNRPSTSIGRISP